MIATALNRLNTRAVGFAGLGLGAVSLVSAVIVALRALFALLSSPAYLVHLAAAFNDVHAHRATDADHLAIAQLVGAALSVAGAFSVLLVASLLLAYIGRPLQIHDGPPPGGHA